MMRYTLRGRVQFGTPKRLILDDGQFTKGHKVLAVHTWPASITGGEDAQVTLSLQYDASTAWNAGDNRQIGWAAFRNGSTGSTETVNTFSLIDPNKIVVRDLWIVNDISGTTTTNYMVVLERQDMTEDEAVLQLIKETSQDDTR